MSLSYTRIPNTNYIVPSDDQNFLPAAIETGGILLEQSIAIIPEVQALGPKDIVVDIGALYGDTALIFAKNGAIVHAFEPQIDSCIAAVWNTKDNPRIKVHHMAIGDGRSVIVNDNPINGNLGTRTVSESENGTKTISLDSIFLGIVTMIKIDCEGFEFFALTGAFNSIKTLRPILIIEIYPEMLERQGCTKDQIYTFLTDLEYTIETCVGEEDSVRWDIIARP